MLKVFFPAKAGYGFAPSEEKKFRALFSAKKFTLFLQSPAFLGSADHPPIAAHAPPPEARMPRGRFWCYIGANK